MAGFTRVRNRGALASMFVACSLTALLASGVAFAHHYDSLYPTATTGSNCSSGGMGSGACRTDNKSVTYHYEPTIGYRAANAVADRIATQYEPTNLNFLVQNPPVFSGSAETDIIFGTRNFILSSFGWIVVTWCDDATSGTLCDQHYVYFDLGWYDTNNWDKRRGNACHEVGHAIGLKHGSDASPVVSDSAASLRCLGIPSSTWIYLGSHNEDQINGQWN